MPNIKTLPLEWLADPVSKKFPRFEGGIAHCESGDYRYNAEQHYWDFVPKGIGNLFGDQWPVWQQLQDNGVVSYQNDPSKNLGVGHRPDFLAFAKFCGFRGAVLDVGCGPQRVPTHMAATSQSDVFFVGIDPLVGEQPREFPFVLGVGEYLPFREGVFDQVLFVTSLDHFLDPVPPLREAKRVLSSEGEVCVWIGEKDKNAPRPQTSPEWYQRLKVPPGADDVFHYRRFTVAEFERCAASAGLNIADRSVTEVDQWRKHFFYRLRSRKP